MERRFKASFTTTTQETIFDNGKAIVEEVTRIGENCRASRD